MRKRVHLIGHSHTHIYIYKYIYHDAPFIECKVFKGVAFFYKETGLAQLVS